MKAPIILWSLIMTAFNLILAVIFLNLMQPNFVEVDGILHGKVGSLKGYSMSQFGLFIYCYLSTAVPCFIVWSLGLCGIGFVNVILRVQNTQARHPSRTDSQWE